jgi:hypothetical protein
MADTSDLAGPESLRLTRTRVWLTFGPLLLRHMKTWIMLTAAMATGFLSGCTSTATFRSIQIGMSRAEVISIAGHPDVANVRGDTEHLEYRLFVPRSGDNLYIFTLYNGKVRFIRRVIEPLPPPGSGPNWGSLGDQESDLRQLDY